MPNIEVDFQTYLPHRISYLNLNLILSKQFKMDINIIFQYDHKKMLANLYSGDLEIHDVTKYSKDQISDFAKSQKKSKTLDDFIYG